MHFGHKEGQQNVLMFCVKLQSNKLLHFGLQKPLFHQIVRTLLEGELEGSNMKFMLHITFRFFKYIIHTPNSSLLCWSLKVPFPYHKLFMALEAYFAK
jgi:hypothetical protein